MSSRSIVVICREFSISWLLALPLVIGCSVPVSIGGEKGGGGSGGSVASGGGGARTGDQSGGGGSEGHVFGIFNCTLPCATSADCDDHTEDADADNHTCTGSFCEWNGCNNDQECSDAYGAEYVCVTNNSTGDLPGCVKSCLTSTSCDDGNPAHDGDNYVCNSGACEYIGCHDDMECSDTYGAGFGCFVFQGIPYKMCWQGCQSDSDCGLGTPGLDQDNFTCVQGVCEYMGCNNNAECDATWPGTVCKTSI